MEEFRREKKEKEKDWRLEREKEEGTGPATDASLNRFFRGEELSLLSTLNVMLVLFLRVHVYCGCEEGGLVGNNVRKASWSRQL